MSKKLLGILLYQHDIHELTKEISKYITRGVHCLISTPNPEIIVEAHNNSALLRVLQNSTFAVCDGIGLGFVTGAPVIKGRELFDSLLSEANNQILTIYFLTGSQKSLSGSMQKVTVKYPNTKVYGAVGPILDINANPINEQEKAKEQKILKDINDKNPQIIFVGYGCPKQELWIDRIKDMIKPTCWMTVGGTLDVFGGVLPIPPKIFLIFNLEWLYRLILEPKRIIRISTAVILFPFLFITKQIT